MSDERLGLGLPAAEAAVAPGRAAAGGRELPEPAFAYLLLLPTLLVSLALLAYPLVYSLWISLFQVDVYAPVQKWTFVGLKNYVEAIRDPTFPVALFNTLYFALFTIVGATGLGLLFALVLNERFPGRAAVRVLVMIPWSLSQVMVAITFGWLFNSQFGALNGLLYQLGIIGKYQFWFADGFRALNFLGVAFVWSLVPFATLLFLGALQTVPPELHQAAKVDGANVFRRFYHVTLPWIQPTMLVVLIVATLNGFLAFALIYLITAGGPGESTTVLSWWGYSTTFRARDVGKGAAIFYLLTFIIFGLSALYIRLFMRHDEQLST
jgi:multiple sugar transport system permease protein